jgi:putative ABC transport system permease protein
MSKTAAVQPGSRVTWRYKFGGTPQQLEAYEKWLLPQLKPEQRWYGLEQDEGALGKSLERSQQFLLLSALLTLLLAVAAVAVAMNHYCRSRYDLVAILKTLGAGRAQLRKLIIGQWLMVLALSGVTGGLFGLLFERVLVVLLKPVLPGELPPASLWPWLWALGTMTVISLLVGLRPYRLLGDAAAAGTASRRGGKRLAAEGLSARSNDSCGCAAGRIDGRKYAAVGGAGRGCGAGAAVRRVGLDAA